MLTAPVDKSSQVPLALFWMITIIHKGRGKTVEKATIDFGKSEDTAGLTSCASTAGPGVWWICWLSLGPSTVATSQVKNYLKA